MILKKLDRYLLTSFFKALAVTTIAFGLTIIIINVVEELRDFIDNEVPLITILEYYFYWGGWVIKSFLPMFVLIAVLFSVSMFARRNELLAMKASGLSLYRITLPYAAAAVVLTAAHFYYNEYIFPPANQRRVEIKEFVIRGHSRQSHTNVKNIYRQISPGYFFTIGRFNADRDEGSDLKIYETEGSRLVRLVTADVIQFRNHHWQAMRGVERTFVDGRQNSFEEFTVMPLPDIDEKPESFAKRVGKPEDMGLEDLREYIDNMKRTGGPHLRESVDLGIKFAYPLTSLVVILVSIPFASNPRRSGLAVSISGGAVISLVYFVLFRVLQSAGYNEKVPLEVAVWGVNSLFFVIGILAMLKARK